MPASQPRPYELVSVVAPCEADDASRLAPYAEQLAQLEVPAELVVVGSGGRGPLPAADGVEVRVVESPGRGWGRAVRHGLQASRGDLLSYVHPRATAPQALGEALRLALGHPGVIVRVNRRARASLGRRIASLAFNVECRLLLGITSWDVNATPKVFPADALPRLGLSRDDGLLDAELVVAAEHAGIPVIELPVSLSAGDAPVGAVEALRMFGSVAALRRARRGS